MQARCNDGYWGLPQHVHQRASLTSCCCLNHSPTAPPHAGHSHDKLGNSGLQLGAHVSNFGLPWNVPWLVQRATDRCLMGCAYGRMHSVAQRQSSLILVTSHRSCPIGAVATRLSQVSYHGPYHNARRGRRLTGSTAYLCIHPVGTDPAAECPHSFLQVGKKELFTACIAAWSSYASKLLSPTSTNKNPDSHHLIGGGLYAESGGPPQSFGTNNMALGIHRPGMTTAAR